MLFSLRLSNFTERGFSNSITFKNRMQASLHDIEHGLERVVEEEMPGINSVHYKRVGKGVGDSCSFGAYLAKKGKKRVSMTPTIASM